MFIIRTDAVNKIVVLGGGHDGGEQFGSLLGADRRKYFRTYKDLNEVKKRLARCMGTLKQFVSYWDDKSSYCKEYWDDTKTVEEYEEMIEKAYHAIRKVQTIEEFDKVFGVFVNKFNDSEIEPEDTYVYMIPKGF